MHIDGEISPVNNEIENTNQYDITELPPKMQRFIHLYVTGQYTLQKLSDLLEVHPNTLGNWLKRKDVKWIISDMQGTTHDIVASQLKALTTTAVGKLADLLNSPIDGVALQAVKDILDRAGHKPSQEIKVDKRVVTFEQRLNSLIDDVIDVSDYEVIEDE
mgnify:CR=1 FL=1